MRRIPFLPRRPRVAVIRLQGTIATGARGALNDATLAPAIEKAFRKGKPDAVALAINSPGGSPVQASLIAARIRRLADENQVKVHAFVEDVAASGGYWLACAGDEIWADASSIVGSIGVIMASFGLDRFINEHGIERRVYTAGKHKSQLDPFLPENPEDVARIKALGSEIHRAFIAHVKARRGPRLAEGEDLFEGDFWSGQRAQELGLVDGLAHLVPKMKELYGEKVRFSVFGPRRGLLTRLGTALSHEAIAAIDERAAFARYGL